VHRCKYVAAGRVRFAFEQGFVRCVDWYWRMGCYAQAKREEKRQMMRINGVGRSDRKGLCLVLAMYVCALTTCHTAWAGNIRDVKFTTVTAVEFRVSWISDTDELGSVNYGETPGALSNAQPDDEGVAVSQGLHHVTIVDLSPETTYYFEIVSGDVTHDDDGQPFSVTTGPVGAPAPGQELAWGQVFLSDDTTPAAGCIVYLMLNDVDGEGTAGESQEISTVTDGNGYYSYPLNTLRTADSQPYYEFSSEGDEEVIFVQGGTEGTASTVVDIAEDEGIQLALMPHSVNAAIDSITPNLQQEGLPVQFAGSGTCSQGHDIVEYEWSSDIDGVIGTEASFTKSDLSAGSHDISLRVRCDADLWSDPVEWSGNPLVIIEHTVVATIDSITPNPVDVGMPVQFEGSGTCSQGHDIVKYEWRSDVDGLIGTAASFTTSSLSAGVHNITLTVTCAGDLSSDETVWNGNPLRVRGIVDSLQPPMGQTSGGAEITISGTGFEDTATVQFGGVDADNVVVSATEITCETPPHAAGPVDVTVTQPSGTITLEHAYTYYGVDIDGNMSVNCVDIQLVINCVLGIDISPFSGDCNGDARRDAVDVQLVIIGALFEGTTECPSGGASKTP